MSTSTQPEGTEVNPAENTSEQSRDEAKMIVDEYQIVAVAPVEFFTPERLNNHSSKYIDEEKYQVETLEDYIEELTNFDYKIFAEQIDMNDLERELIDKESYNFDMDNQNKIIEEVIDINEITKLIKGGMDKRNHFKDILGSEFIDKINDCINEFFSDEKGKKNYYLSDIHKIAKTNKDRLYDLMDYNINYSLWTQLMRKNSKDHFWCELDKQLRDIIPQNDKVAIARIELLIAEAKANVDNKEPIDEIFGNRLRMSRRAHDLPDVRSVLSNAERELREEVEYDVDEDSWAELEQDLANITQYDDNEIVANIIELTAETKNNKATDKSINELFENIKQMLREQDLPDVRSVLSNAERELREEVEYDVDEDSWAELEQDLANITQYDDNEIVANIIELTAETKNNKATDKSINELFGNIKQMLREQDLPDVRSVLSNAERELREEVEYDVDEDSWAELEQDLANITQYDDNEIVANIIELTAETKNNKATDKSINELFGNIKQMLREQDLPDVRSVLSNAKRKLREQAEKHDAKHFLDDLEQQLKATIPQNDNVALAHLNLLVAEANDEILGDRYRILWTARDLPDMHTVLRDAERKLRKHTKYNVDSNFWDKLKKNLSNVTLNDDNKTSAKINKLIEEAKNNIAAAKPIDEIFGNRFRMSRRARDLPDMHTVLRDAERKLRKHTKYNVDSNFWDKLKKNLSNVTLNDDNKTSAKINKLIEEAKNNIAAAKPIDEIFGNRFRMSRRARDLPDMHTVLRDAERKLRKHTKYNVDSNFWDKLKKNLSNVTLNDDNKTSAKINKLIDEAKANVDNKKPINEIFGNRFRMSRRARDLPDMHTVLKDFKARISITYCKDKSEFNKFINFFKEDLKDLNVRLSFDDKSILEICRSVSEKLEEFNNKLTNFEDTLQAILNDEQSVIKEESIKEKLEKINTDNNIESNINEIEIMLENFKGNDTNDSNLSKDQNKVAITGKIYAKLNELYNFSAFGDYENSNVNNENTKDYFLDKLPKYLLIEEILSDPEFDLDARHLKSVDILVAIPQNPSDEKTSTEIVLLLVIDINLEEGRELLPEDFEIGKMLLNSSNVKDILDLVYNRFHINNKTSEFNELLGKKSVIKDSSILHIISCPNFEFDSALELSQAQQNLMERIIPGFSIARLNQDNSELKYVPRKNNDTNKISSVLISYLNQSLAIKNQNNSSEDNYRNHMIGLQIISQSFLQRLSQYNDALRSIAIAENRDDLLDNKTETSMFNNQLHYTYTIPDEVINLSKQHSDIAALRELLTSTAISNQTEIFKERRETFFIMKENYENWQRDSVIQLSLVGLAVVTIVFSILELSNRADYIKLLIALGIISFLAVILMLKFSVFKEIKRICTNIKSKVFSRKKKATP